MYLRGESERSHEVLAGAFDPEASTPDAALVTAWLSQRWGYRQTDRPSRQRPSRSRRRPRAAIPQLAPPPTLRQRSQRRPQGIANSMNASTGWRSEPRAKPATTSSSPGSTTTSAPRRSRRGTIGADRRGRLALAASPGHGLFEAFAMTNKADALIRTGELDEARSLLVQALERPRTTGVAERVRPVHSLRAARHRTWGPGSGAHLARARSAARGTRRQRSHGHAGAVRVGATARRG